MGNQLWMAIFNSYLSLPEGTLNMVYVMENAIKIDDLGVLQFQETSNMQQWMWKTIVYNNDYTTIQQSTGYAQQSTALCFFFSKLGFTGDIMGYTTTLISYCSYTTNNIQQ